MRINISLLKEPVKCSISQLSGRVLPPTCSLRIQHALEASSPFPSFLANSRYASSASSSRWKTRQANDHFAREARVSGLKSRAAFKLLQINDKHRIFKRGNTVVDLGYAPGSWSQVAANRTAPGGRVVGVDLLPAQPPRGVSTIQGNFLSPEVQAEVRAYLTDSERGRAKTRDFGRHDEGDVLEGDKDEARVTADEPGYLDSERHAALDAREADTKAEDGDEVRATHRERVVDVVLSDMSEPWEQTSGFWKNSISNPYYRMMNTSGLPFRDHAGSMDLCYAALTFAYDTLRTGGHLVCKFYQGSEDKLLETRLKRLFEKVHRDKPEASRSESREGYFVAMKRKEAPSKEQVFAE